MKQIRKRLTYANVMSTIAVFLVIGGASAFAATELGKNSVGTKQLKANAVTSAKIKKEAVGTAKIKNGAVGAGKIGPGAVTADQLTSGSVTGEKLATNSVTAAKLATNSVETTKIAKNAVTNEKIAEGAVNGGKLANNSVNSSKVADGSLTGSDINQGSLNAVKAANVYGVTFQEVGGPKIIHASDPGIKSGGCFFVCAVEFPRVITDCSYTVSPIDQGSGSGVPAILEAFPSSNTNSVIVIAYNDEGGLIAHDWAMTVVCPTAT